MSDVDGVRWLYPSSLSDFSAHVSDNIFHDNNETVVVLLADADDDISCGKVDGNDDGDADGTECDGDNSVTVRSR